MTEPGDGPGGRTDADGGAGPTGPVSRRFFLGGVTAGAAAGAGLTSAAPAQAAPRTGAPDAADPAAGGHSGGLPLRNRMRTEREWAAFLARQDLVWKRLPTKWYEGPYLGNGRLGVMVYREPGRNAVRFNLNHTEVQDHRPEFGTTFGLARLPVGHFTLEPAGTITAVDWRLDLWNAELRGTVTTDKGRLTLRALVHNDRSVLVASVTASAGERGYRWVFRPGEPISTRVLFQPIPPGYTGNQPPVRDTAGDVTVVDQRLLAGGQHVTAYREVDTGRGERTLLVNVTPSFPELTATGEAVRAVRRAAAFPVSALVRSHRRWWHEFYPRSFLSLPDARMQSFYWIQLYKTAAATREDAPVMATCGPWLEPTPWPAVWWNLNVQLEYWLIHGSNHLELDAVTRSLSEYRAELVNNTPEPYRADSLTLTRTTDMVLDGGAGTGGQPGQPSPTPEVGNLTWALHNVWLTYRHTMDDDLLRDTLFPLLRKAVNYYLHFLAPGPDGKLHLPFTSSPEYGVNAPDCNYDLALLRWGCQTLLEACERLGTTDPLQPRWREVLADLVDYPVDANGLMVGAGVPFAKSHRHYSHLLMIYPLYLMTWEQPRYRELIDTSLRHWISFEGALQGYSFTGAASISAQQGRGNEARFYLSELLRRFVQPNTMYKESGPVIETPLSAAQSLHDMLCQSWGGVIRIFPAVPDAWADITLHDFRTQGAFLVSAVRKGGVTRFVRVRSLRGERCVLRHGLPVRGADRLRVTGEFGRRDLGGGDIEIELRRGAEAVVYPAGTRPDFAIAPVPVTEPGDPWGLQPLPPLGEVVTVDLAPYLDNDGVSADERPADGDFDGTGMTYPAADLPAAGELVHEGARFVFPSTADGAANNVTARGQSLPVPPGRYAKLRVLGAGSGGNVTVDATARYADGTTGRVRIALSDWIREAGSGEIELLRTTHRNSPAGRNSANAAIFHQVVALDPARELHSLTLPALTSPQAHLFALSLEKPVT
jgi:alpha-L-fucosidase 2